MRERCREIGVEKEEEEFVDKMEKTRWERGTVWWRDLGRREMAAMERWREHGGKK